MAHGLRPRLLPAQASYGSSRLTVAIPASSVGTREGPGDWYRIPDSACGVSAVPGDVTGSTMRAVRACRRRRNSVHIVCIPMDRQKPDRIDCDRCRRVIQTDAPPAKASPNSVFPGFQQKETVWARRLIVVVGRDARTSGQPVCREVHYRLGLPVTRSAAAARVGTRRRSCSTASSPAQH
jgi:hypothetical protein